MISTIFHVDGMRTNDDVLAVRAAMYKVTGVGGFSTETETEDDGMRIILKHKDDVVLDRDVIDKALREAGDYSVA